MPGHSRRPSRPSRWRWRASASGSGSGLRRVVESVVAVLLGSGSLIVLQAGSSAVPVATLLPPSGAGGLDRMIDALAGCLMGLAAAALPPAGPPAPATRHASRRFEAPVDALRRISAAIGRAGSALATQAPAAARTAVAILAAGVRAAGGPSCRGPSCRGPSGGGSRGERNT
ncbi:hypothetical protein [Nonomuraea sp. NPDC049709]|uniref:hypothetical protein n=1 Tax=Nonomuraea sp. NPDC049709 TaxID=3154736 RepID=UPI0034426107